MMQFGQAAGVAAAIAAADGSELRQIDPALIRSTMQTMIDLNPAPIFND